MGRESKQAKQRVCKTCEKVTMATAQELTEHAQMCLRAKQSGLVLPGGIILSKPGLTIRRVED